MKKFIYFLFLIFMTFVSCSKEMKKETVNIPDSTKSIIRFLEDKEKIILSDSFETQIKGSENGEKRYFTKLKPTLDELPEIKMENDNLINLIKYFYSLQNSEGIAAGNSLNILTKEEIYIVIKSLEIGAKRYETKMNVYLSVDTAVSRVLDIPVQKLSDDRKFKFSSGPGFDELAGELTFVVRKYLNNNQNIRITSDDVKYFEDITDCKHFIINYIEGKEK